MLLKFLTTVVRAIAHLAERHEMIVADQTKTKLEAPRENPKLRRRQQLAFVA